MELFKMWQRELRSKELYDEVRQELKDLVEYEGAERAKAQQKTAERFTRTVAALGGLGVFAGLLGMNILPFKDGGEFVPTVFASIVKGMPFIGALQEKLSSFKDSEPIIVAIVVTTIVTVLVGCIAYFFGNPIDRVKVTWAQLRHWVSRRKSQKMV